MNSGYHVLAVLYGTLVLSACGNWRVAVFAHGAILTLFKLCYD